MSRSITGPRSDAPTDAVKPQIHYYDDHVTIRIDRADWNEGLEKHAKSAKISIDKAVRSAWKVSEASGFADDSGVLKANHSVLQSDPRDEIPVIYNSASRRIISAIGCLLSTGAIIGINIAGNSGNVPGFEKLPLMTDGEWDNALVIVVGSVVAGLAVSIDCIYTTIRSQHD